MTRDPNSYIQASADALAETLLSKNSDYAPTGEFSNFEKSAELAGISVTQLITAQVAIKMTRIEKLIGTTGAPKVIGESLMDSFLDLAGYATIGHAWLSQLQGATEYNEASEAPRVADLIGQVFVTDRAIIRNLADDECFHSWAQVGNDVSERDGCGEQRHG